MELQPPSLPQELVDSVIDHLHDCPGTLVVCALVHRSWLPSARHHLFSNIFFGSKTKCGLFRLSIITNPSLIYLIRTVSVHAVINDFYSALKDVTFFNLQHFEISDVSVSSIPQLHFVLARCMPNLVSMEFTNCFWIDVTVFDRLFQNVSARFRSVSLQRIYVSPDGDNATAMNRLAVPQRRHRMESLVLGHSNVLDWIFHPRSSLDFRSLKELELTREFHILETILPYITRTLEHLSITGSMGNVEVGDVMKVTDIPAPRVTRLTISLSRMSLHMLLAWVSKRHLQALQEISLIFFYEELDDRLALGGQNEISVPRFGWSDVDRILSQVRSLRVVEIHGDFKSALARDADEMEERRQQFYSLLPILSYRRLLSYN